MADNKIIDGKLIAATIKKEIATEVANMIDQGQDAPHLAAIIVGEDGLITYSCMLAADSIYFTDEAYYYYRSIGTSLCHNMNTKRLSENHIMFETYDKLIDLNSYPMLKKQLHYFFAYQSL
ncbi:MAG: hypothetical protein IIX06_04770, partial [Bacteroidales bacterium]|nr:hypothetical protein [Bacteroidales bacterium]